VDTPIENRPAQTEAEWNAEMRRRAGLDVPKSTAEVLATQPAAPPAMPVYESAAAFNLRCHLEQAARDAAAKSGQPSDIPSLRPPVPPAEPELTEETFEAFKDKLFQRRQTNPSRFIVR
jgi:hypothetical protein